MGRSHRRIAALSVLALACATTAHACSDLAKTKQDALDAKATWIGLTEAQWNFARGVYIYKPDTPKGMPFGDSAAIVRRDDRSGSLIFFIDGDKACSPMALPSEVTDFLLSVGEGFVKHEGQPN